MKSKQQVREEFRNRVFQRDGFSCAVCGFSPADPSELDAHHVVSRDVLPFGGYCRQNGITLCTDRSRPGEDCHTKAETLHATGSAVPGYAPADLYVKIRSSYPAAFRGSLELGLPALQVASVFDVVNGRVAGCEADVCLRLGGVSPSPETWELACDELGLSPGHGEILDEMIGFVRSYGSGRPSD